MKKILLLCFLFIVCGKVRAQTPDWSTSIAPLFYSNCTPCHHPGGIGHFSLLTYNYAILYANTIRDVVEFRKMPPWPANPDYRHFKDEAILDSLEIVAILDWIDNGLPLGDTTLAPNPPSYPIGGSLLDSIHHTIQISPYTLSSNNDEYRYFAFHSGFLDTVYVNQIEVIPGLPHLVHHADIHFDLSGTAFYNDSITPVSGFSSGLISNYYMNAWQPGGGIASYPNNWGIKVPPGADFVFEIHYGPGGVGQIDTTKMNLRFITNPQNVRKINVAWLLNNPIPSQGPLIIPPNVITTFDQESSPMSGDKSLIAICPHMHYLGASYKVWFVTLTGDSIPLIDIPDWDFHWQKYYTFQYIQKIPAGARLKAIASFDNTINNPYNPNNPPITEMNGPTTTDEMLMTYFIYANYQAGDENILLDSSLLATYLNDENVRDDSPFTLYPNPAVDVIHLQSKSIDLRNSKIIIRNNLGQNVYQDAQLSNESFESISIQTLPVGIYLLELQENNKSSTKRFIKY
ncbi:MAG: T9SS type A sorting domain-containing protein [Bacteroidetes bacterium]|nr:T9SS type A sorting domain-containing protein [Bacteroidota bacterium]